MLTPRLDDRGRQPRHGGLRQAAGGAGPVPRPCLTSRRISPRTGRSGYLGNHSGEPTARTHVRGASTPTRSTRCLTAPVRSIGWPSSAATSPASGPLSALADQTQLLAPIWRPRRWGSRWYGTASRLRTSPALEALVGHTMEEQRAKGSRFLYLDSAEHERVGRILYDDDPDAGPRETDTTWVRADGTTFSVHLSARRLVEDDPISGAISSRRPTLLKGSGASRSCGRVLPSTEAT